MSVTCTVAPALSLFTFTVAFALCAEVIAEHGSEDKIFFRCEFVEWTGNDESDSLQAFAAPEVNVQVLLSCRLQQIRNALTFQSLNGLFTIFLIAGEQHHKLGDWSLSQ